MLCWHRTLMKGCCELRGARDHASRIDESLAELYRLIRATRAFEEEGTPLQERRTARLGAAKRRAVHAEGAVRLKQLGRLIRTDETHRTATILDRRLVYKRWGGVTMRGLPDFEVVVEPAGRRASTGSRG